ncbi:MAG TPA: pyrroline-5-carboxylate reductase, partial [Candidatus Hydrogenedentes bacterium]|nr:pyrroline-5-carboxylate reductase [Candidatus Hydrogenedentota bacterium]
MALEGTLGFLGFGNMGGAILRGLIQSGTLPAERAVVFDIEEGKCAAARDLGVAVAESEADLARRSDIVLLAVKPQTMNEALGNLKPGFTEKTLVISIAAGVSIAYLRERLGPQVRAIRVMPNTPAMVGAGAAAFAASDNAADTDRQAAQTIFGTIGIAVEAPEAAMDAVTALSGSGPAYFFYMVECLVRAAVREGLTEDQATRLAAQTALGAGRLLSESGESAAVLRERVT